MRRHWAYLKYVLKHKWFVFIASRMIGSSLWRALIHDLSKFRPSEWFAYANTFYGSDGSKLYNPTSEFDVAWLLHQHRNPHHWQYWILREDNPESGELKILEMPHKYTLEMVADWMGAGRAIMGRWECSDWYMKHKSKILLHPSTEALVVAALAFALVKEHSHVET